jgi:putative aldouronate transport system permease protein
MSVSRVVVGVPASVLFTAAFAYGVSKPYLVGQKLILRVMLITMYVNGGIIPTFILIKSVGLYQNFWVYIVPLLFNAYNAIILVAYFRTVPAEIEESVKIDGGTDLAIFFRVALPISLPVIATIALFVAVAQWNSWFDTILYGGRDLITLQAKLVEIIRDADAARKLEAAGMGAAASIVRAHFKPTVESVKATAMMVSAIPIICVYPFAQKYFVKGIMIGSLKG